MLVLMSVLFLLGYFFIAMEHVVKVDKAAVALLTGMALWVCYVYVAPGIVPSMQGFQSWLAETTDQALLSSDGMRHKVLDFVVNVQIIEHLGDISSILFFLMGAMTIVELVDVHGGFNLITDHVKTRNKKKLLWLLVFITFFMSAILDNLTTTIVMIMLLRRLVNKQQDRWIFAGMIVIAANSGGAFSPIGDVTTIMLWVKGNVTTAGLIPNLILPSLASAALPAFIMSFSLKGELSPLEDVQKAQSDYEKSLAILPSASDYSACITPRDKQIIFVLGVAALIFVPIFKSITHLPPFVGVLLGLGVIWVYTEVMYQSKHNMEEHHKHRITRVLSHIDVSTILFFLGILLAVAALQCAGILNDLNVFLDTHVGNIYIINIIIGAISSIVDNVPLVAGAVGMYPLADVGVFAQDGVFWLFLAYCAGVGGSMLIIGSAAGVMAMGLEKINFIWYLKHISWLALVGYLCGALIFVLQEFLLNGGVLLNA